MSEKKIGSRLRRITVLAAAVSVLALLAGSLVLRYMQQSLEKEALRQMEAEASEYRMRIMKQIDGDFQVLNTLASFLGSGFVTDDRKFLEALSEANENNDFLTMAYLEKEGTGVVASCGKEGQTGITLESFSPEARPVIAGAWEGEQGISRLFQSDVVQERIFVYAVPVRSGGEVIGALTASDRIEIFSDILKGDGVLGGNGYLHMIGSEGNFLIRSPRAVVQEETASIFDGPYLSERDTREAQKAMAEQQPYHARFSYQGHTYQFLMEPVGLNGWYLFCVNTVRAATAGTYRMVQVMQIIFILTLSVLLLLLGYGYRVTRKNHARLIQLAYQDQLTGADNLARFQQQLPDSLKDSGGCVAAMNIRQFAFIKEIFGENQADRLLCYMKKVMDDHIRPGEFFCRDASDWFYLFLRDVEPKQIHSRLEALMDEITSVSEKSGSSYQLVIYCGAAIARSQNRTEEEARAEANGLMTHVIFALDTARGAYQNNIWFYDAQLHKKEELENYVESHMEQALQDGEFRMYLQPKFDLREGKLSGAEALVRWITGTGKMIFPDQFIPLFEKNGFCVRLDLYMAECACRQIRKWIDEGLEPVPISVNQSKLLFFEEDYVRKLCELTEKYEVPEGMLTLEILEGMALENGEELNRKIIQLQKKGFRVSMDDFGSGFSSLNTLSCLRIDELKLDRGFLMNGAQGEGSERTRMIVAQVIQMAARMGIATVAEGVETREDEEMLKEMGCDCGQGYYYSRPIETAVFQQTYMERKAVGNG